MPLDASGKAKSRILYSLIKPGDRPSVFTRVAEGDEACLSLARIRQLVRLLLPRAPRVCVSRSVYVYFENDSVESSCFIVFG
jgi:hypothetical protein